MLATKQVLAFEVRSTARLACYKKETQRRSTLTMHLECALVRPEPEPVPEHAFFTPAAAFVFEQEEEKEDDVSDNQQPQEPEPAVANRGFALDDFDF